MGRKINAAVLGASFILPGVAGALGLGDITLNSTLNQPLNADITIRKAGDLSPAEILANLASIKEFNALGVDRSYFLQDLQFNVDFANDGTATIHLTTRKAVVEPFLNFIIEVQWPEGKLLKEYTLLLDPPVFSQEPSPAVVPPASDIAKIQQSRVQGRASEVKMPTYSPDADSQSPGTSSGEAVYGPVSRSDSLWVIAKKTRPNKSFTIHQTMVAIQNKNPDAFLRNNINLLKEGQILRLPTPDEILSNSYQEALDSVKQQNQSWKDLTNKRVKTDASVETDSESQLGGNVEQAPEDQAEGDGRLTLVAGADADQDSAGALGATEGESTGETISGLQQALSLKEESLDKSILENDNLIAQFEEVNAQLETSTELIQVKDEQIASLQKQLLALEQKAKQSPVAAPSSTDSQNTSVLDSPLTLAGIGAAIIALIVGLTFARRKSSEDESDELPEQEFEAGNLLDNDSSEKDSIAEEDELDPTEENSLEEDGELVATEQDNTVKQELGDVIGEADIYIAYGRFSHAVELLRQGCDAEPDREDIRLKLLEVLVELNDMDEFTRHDTILRRSTDESVIQASNVLYEKIHGAVRWKEADELNSEHDLTEDSALDSGFEEGETSVSEEESTFSLGEELEIELDTESEAEVATESLDSSVEEVQGFEMDAEDLQASSEDDILSPELEFELPDMESSDEEEVSLDLDIETNDMDSVELASEEAEESGFQIELGEDETLGSLDTDDFSDLEIDLVEDASASGDASDEIDLSDGDFALDLDDLASVEDDVELDIGSLADSLEDAGVDFSDMAEPVSEEDLAGLTDVSAESPSNDPVSDEVMTGDINLDEDDLDMLSDLDENATKLDLARAYLEMGDGSGAKEILEEVLSDGNDTQKNDAEELLQKIA